MCLVREKEREKRRGEEGREGEVKELAHRAVGLVRFRPERS